MRVVVFGASVKEVAAICAAVKSPEATVIVEQDETRDVLEILREDLEPGGLPLRELISPLIGELDKIEDEENEQKYESRDGWDKPVKTLKNSYVKQKTKTPRKRESRRKETIGRG